MQIVKAVRLAPMIVLLAVSAAAQGNLDKVQQSFRHSLVGQQVTARFPYSDNDVVLSADGNCRSGCTRGSWASDGTHIVRKVEISADEFVITCDRLVVYYDKADQPRAVLTNYPIRFRIKLNGPPEGNSLMQALRSVFHDTNEPPPSGLPPDPERAPGFEMKKTKSHFLVREKGGSEWKELLEVDVPLEIGELPDREKVYLVSKAVKPPRAVSSPDPTFPTAERNQRHQGNAILRVVVDSLGRVQAMKVEYAGNPAFVHSAVLAVARWKFDPATLNGRPVACEINVEVNFRLY